MYERDLGARRADCGEARRAHRRAAAAARIPRARCAPPSARARARPRRARPGTPRNSKPRDCQSTACRRASAAATCGASDSRSPAVKGPPPLGARGRQRHLARQPLHHVEGALQHRGSSLNQGVGGESTLPSREPVQHAELRLEVVRLEQAGHRLALRDVAPGLPAELGREGERLLREALGVALEPAHLDRGAEALVEKARESGFELLGGHAGRSVDSAARRRRCARRRLRRGAGPRVPSPARRRAGRRARDGSDLHLRRLERNRSRARAQRAMAALAGDRHLPPRRAGSRALRRRPGGARAVGARRGALRARARRLRGGPRGLHPRRGNPRADRICRRGRRRGLPALGAAGRRLPAGAGRRLRACCAARLVRSATSS